MAVFFPIYRISMGNVATPTIMRLDIKAAIYIVPAPASLRAAAVAKAIKPGIRVIAPTRAARIVPNQPDSVPISWEIVSVSIMDRMIPTSIRIVIN